MRAALLVLLLLGCQRPDADTYVLYRDSPNIPEMRIHVATFDSDNGDTYNRETCGLTRDRFQEHATRRVKFWCEKGRYRK